MARSGALLVGLALLISPHQAEAQCRSETEEIECQGITFAAEAAVLHGDVLEATDALAILPDGRVLQAESLTTSCASTCALYDVTISGASQTWEHGRIDHLGVTLDDRVLPLGEPPEPGIAAVETRLVDSAPTLGVGVLVPTNSERAIGTVAAAGTDSFGISGLLFAGASPSTRLDVARVAGRTGFVASGAERIEAGPIQLSLDGSLGNGEGRRFFAGSQRHFGVGREELVAGLSAGDSNGLFSLRYIASREASGVSDEIQLDGIAQAEFSGLNATLEVGAGAASRGAQFAPSLGTALTLETPLHGYRWGLVPRAVARVVGEQNQGLVDAASGADSAGLAGGLYAEFTVVQVRDTELRLLADGAYGARLSSGQTHFYAWNSPLDGWRAAGGVEFGAAGAFLLRWLADWRESAEEATHIISADVSNSRSWASGQIRFDVEGYRGAWATVGASSQTIAVRLIALEGESGREDAPVLGREVLRRSRGAFESQTAIAMGVRYRAGHATLEAEATYSNAAVRGPRLGGFGRAGFQLPGKDWGLNALVGSLVGEGDLSASLGLQLGRHPGLSGWHLR